MTGATASTGLVALYSTTAVGGCSATCLLWRQSTLVQLNMSIVLYVYEYLVYVTIPNIAYHIL